MAVVLAAVGCSSPPVTAETRWRTADGDPVAADVVTVRPGDEHCDWSDTVVMTVDLFELGLAESPHAGQDPYMWEPDRVGVADQELTVPFARDVPLPLDAVDTGLRTGNLELWLVLDPPRGAAYLVETGGDNGERWPMLAIGCA